MFSNYTYIYYAYLTLLFQTTPHVFGIPPREEISLWHPSSYISWECFHMIHDVSCQSFWTKGTNSKRRNKCLDPQITAPFDPLCRPNTRRAALALAKASALRCSTASCDRASTCARPSLSGGGNGRNSFLLLLVRPLLLVAMHLFLVAIIVTILEMNSKELFFARH